MNFLLIPLFLYLKDIAEQSQAPLNDLSSSEETKPLIDKTSKLIFACNNYNIIVMVKSLSHTHTRNYSVCPMYSVHSRGKLTCMHMYVLHSAGQTLHLHCTKLPGA